MQTNGISNGEFSNQFEISASVNSGSLDVNYFVN